MRDVVVIHRIFAVTQDFTKLSSYFVIKGVKLFMRLTCLTACLHGKIDHIKTRKNSVKFIYYKDNSR